MNSESPLPANGKKPGSWKKPLVFTLTGLALVLGAVIAYDTKLEPYDDLLPKPDPVKDISANGFYFLYDKWGKIPKRDADILKRVDKMRNFQEPFDEAFVATLRMGAESAAADLHTALEMPTWGAGSYKMDQGFISFSQLMPPVRILSEEAWILAHKGDTANALGIARNIHRLAARMIRENRSLIELLVGVSIQNLSVKVSCDVLARLPGNEEALKAMEEIWREDTITHAAARAALLGEATLFREAMQGKDPVAAGYTNPSTSRLAPLLNLLVKRNLTQNRYHGLLRFLDRDMMNPSASKEAGTGARLEALGAPRMTVSANFIGDRILGYWSKSMGMLPERVVPRGLFFSRAMRVRLALERWKTAHGGVLPSRLAELVPDYLPEVPADPWNGKPLLWDVKTTVIYAVGADWIDNHPIFKDGFLGSETEDPGIRLELPSPAPGALPAPSGGGR